MRAAGGYVPFAGNDAVGADLAGTSRDAYCSGLYSLDRGRHRSTDWILCKLSNRAFLGGSDVCATDDGIRKCDCGAAGPVLAPRADFFAEVGRHRADHFGSWLCCPWTIPHGETCDGSQQWHRPDSRRRRGPAAMTMPFPSAQPGPWSAAIMIAAVVLCSTAGEVLTAAAMKSIGDLDEIRARSGLKGAIRAVITCPLFFGLRRQMPRARRALHRRRPAGRVQSPARKQFGHGETAVGRAHRSPEARRRWRASPSPARPSPASPLSRAGKTRPARASACLIACLARQAPQRPAWR
jgi:hypothetical protein